MKKLGLLGCLLITYGIVQAQDCKIKVADEEGNPARFLLITGKDTLFSNNQGELDITASLQKKHQKKNFKVRFYNQALTEKDYVIPVGLRQPLSLETLCERKTFMLHRKKYYKKS